MGFFGSGKPKQRTTHGSARWATKQEVKKANLWESEKGAVRLPGELYLNDPGHILSIAPTRSGKGTTQVIPSLLFGDSNSVVVIDPKGENAAITKRRRGEFSDVVLFNPWNLHDLRCDAINPFDLLSPDDSNVIDEIDLVAQLIVPDEGGNQAHWTERARQMIAGLMLYLIFHEPAENRHPLTLRSLLRQSTDDWEAMITFMQNSNKADGLVAEAGNELAGYGEREFASVRSTAQRATDVFKGPAMQRALMSSDVDLTRLSKDQISIYLMIPADKLDTHNRITRLLIGLLMQSPIKHRGDRRVVFYLDEFASLGYLEIIERGFSAFAGYGVTLWPFVQDISQLQRHYREGWQSLVANAEVSIFLPNSDQATNEFVSQKSGQTTIRTSSSSYSTNSNGKSSNTSYSDVGRPLITPDEFARLGDHLTNAEQGDIYAVLFKRGMVPLPVGCLPYYEVEWMREKADRNPLIPKEKDATLQPSRRKGGSVSWQNVVRWLKDNRSLLLGRPLKGALILTVFIMTFMIGSGVFVEGPTIFNRLNWGVIFIRSIEWTVFLWIVFVGAVGFWRWMRS